MYLRLFDTKHILRRYIKLAKRENCSNLYLRDRKERILKEKKKKRETNSNKRLIKESKKYLK